MFLHSVLADRVEKVLLITEWRDSLSAKDAVAKWESEHQERDVFAVSQVASSLGTCHLGGMRHLHIELLVVPKGAIRVAA